MDVGQGDATLLLSPQARILIDAGRHDRRDVVPYLKALGVSRIDLFVLTHPHADHIGQCPAVIQHFTVVEVWMSGDAATSRVFERCVDAMLESEVAYYEPRAWERREWEGLRIEVVHPQDLRSDLNGNSISLRITFGQIAFLFTGDAEASSELEMIQRGHDLQAHVLHLGHHGSRTSSTQAFLQAVRPQIAVWSAGSNNAYGHPHPEVLERLARLGVATFGTATHGTIAVRTDGAGYWIQPAFSASHP